MGNTMREMFEKMSPEQQRLQNLQSLIASLVFGRFVGDGYGVMRAKPYSEKYLKEYDEYQNAEFGQRGEISSHGFGFFQETADELKEAGFTGETNIAVEVSRAWRDSETLTQGQIDKCGVEIVKHFANLGILC